MTRAVLVAIALFLAPSAWAQAVVDLDLVLAVDVSGSVNEARFELQRRGYAAAFRDPTVLDAIAAGRHQGIAVTLVQWTGPTLHVIAVDWTLVHDRASAAMLAAAIDAMSRQLFGGGTSLSGAIDFAMTLLPKSPFRGERQVIVSGDGSNNRGRPAASARDEAVKAGVVINGLPILSIEPDLDSYYRDNVIGGPGAFVIAAANYEKFAEAIRDKLVNEIAANPDDSERLAKR
jgi:hypothetical protein